MLTQSFKWGVKNNRINSLKTVRLGYQKRSTKKAAFEVNINERREKKIIYDDEEILN